MYADRDGEEESYILGEYASLDEAIANMPNFFEVISEEKAMTILYMKSAPKLWLIHQDYLFGLTY